MLFVDKHRPVGLDKLTLHPALTDQLVSLAASRDMPHTLFFGPPGAGKKTRVMALLREIFGPGVEKLQTQHKTFQLASRTLDIATVASTHHIEINPSEAGIYDRVVVQELIKEIAENQPLDLQQRSGAAGGGRSFKVVVLDEVDKLTRDAQNGLRRTMEKYMATCRLILICNSITRVIEPLRSRCLPVRVPAPDDEQVIEVLQNVCKKENLQLPDELAVTLAHEAHGNVRRALLMLEATKAASYPFTASTPVQKIDWEVYVQKIAGRIVAEQSPKALFDIRGQFYELLTHCIPPEVILRTLVQDLLPQVDAVLKHGLVQAAAVYEQRMRRGSKAIFHLEAFVARAMVLQKEYIASMMSITDDMLLD